MGQDEVSFSCEAFVVFAPEQESMMGKHFQHSGSHVAVWLAVAIMASPALALAQGLQPVGSEFQINTYTTNAQKDARAAMSADGSFVVVWMSDQQDGDYYGIIGRRYDSAGTPSAEAVINEFTTEAQRDARLAELSGGGFVVVWESYGGDGDDEGIRGRLLGANGQPSGAEFGVNAYTTGVQGDPDVAASADGSFVVVWDSYGQDGSDYAVVARRFDSGGSPLGNDTVVNIFTTADQDDAAVAWLSNGEFVVLWESYEQDGSQDTVIGRRLDSVGQPVGTEFTVNTYTTYGQDDPAVAALGGGGFAVVWESAEHAAGYPAIVGRRFDETATPLDGEFVVGFSTTGYAPLDPDIALEPGGGFLVAWEGEDGDGNGIEARRYDADGQPNGSAFVVNSTTTYDQGLNDHGHLAANAVGDFVVVWDSDEFDLHSYAAVGQRYTISACEDEPRSGCLAAGKAKLQVKDNADDGKDQIKWKWGKGAAFDQDDVGSPVTETTYTLCIYDSTGDIDSLATSLTVAPGASWEDKAPKGAKYKDKTGGSDGVTGAQLKPHVEGKTKVKLKAKGTSIPMPVPIAGDEFFDLDTTVTAQLLNRNGICWTAEFTEAKKNTGDKFKASAP